jgi:hypothetical protein
MNAYTTFCSDEDAERAARTMERTVLVRALLARGWPTMLDGSLMPIEMMSPPQLRRQLRWAIYGFDTKEVPDAKT